MVPGQLSHPKDVDSAFDRKKSGSLSKKCGRAYRNIGRHEADGGSASIVSVAPAQNAE
jgi:hypothetical protein